MFGPQYTGETQIGRGRSGSVYQARSADTGHDVAIKVYDRPLDDRELNGVYAQAFDTIAALAAQRGIAGLHGWGLLDDDRPYLVMPLYALGSLADIVHRDGPLAPAEVLFVASAIGKALATAHSRGVAHGTITPRNILATVSGAVELADFVALQPGSIVRPDAEFGAPEVQGAGELSGTADIYGLARSLHWLLTGTPGSSRSAGSADENVPPFMGAALRGGMADDPAQRPSDVEVFVETLVTSAFAEGIEPTRRLTGHIAPASGLQPGSFGVVSSWRSIKAPGAPAVSGRPADLRKVGGQRATGSAARQAGPAAFSSAPGQDVLPNWPSAPFSIPGAHDTLLGPAHTPEPNLDLSALDVPDLDVPVLDVSAGATAREWNPPAPPVNAIIQIPLADPVRPVPGDLLAAGATAPDPARHRTTPPTTEFAALVQADPRPVTPQEPRWAPQSPPAVATPVDAEPAVPGLPAVAAEMTAAQADSAPSLQPARPLSRRDAIEQETGRPRTPRNTPAKKTSGNRPPGSRPAGAAPKGAKPGDTRVPAKRSPAKRVPGSRIPDPVSGRPGGPRRPQPPDGRRSWMPAVILAASLALLVVLVVLIQGVIRGMTNPDNSSSAVDVTQSAPAATVVGAGASSSGVSSSASTGPKVTTGAVSTQKPASDAPVMFVKVPAVSGLTLKRAKLLLGASGFTVVVSSNTVASPYAAGQVAYSIPAAGKKEPSGSQVVLKVSGTKVVSATPG